MHQRNAECHEALVMKRYAVEIVCFVDSVVHSVVHVKQSL